MSLEHALGARSEAQIDIADDSGDATCRPVIARGTHRRNPADELGLAKRFEFLRSIGSVHRAGLLVQRRPDVVAAPNIGEKVGEQVGVARAVVQMMMRIDDWQTGFEDVLGVLGEPVIADRRLRRRHGGRSRRRLRQGGVRCQSCGAEEPGARGQERAT